MHWSSDILFERYVGSNTKVFLVDKCMVLPQKIQLCTFNLCTMFVT